MRQHKLLWGSSYDRGLVQLLKMWPEIKAKFPDATLSICYGWDLFDKVTVGNQERQDWKKKMVDLMGQPGITEHGRLSKDKLRELREECGILAYCSDFTEIHCITAFECSREGCVPVTTDIGALGEYTTGRVIVKGDIYDEDVKEEYLKQLLALMGDEKRWKQLQKEGQEYAEDFSWGEIAYWWWQEAFNAFTPETQDIKVTCLTPTNRRGFWNIMANNIANQSYKNVEWLIVDDHPDDRSEIAKEYAEKYNLNIKYVRGKERVMKRRYGLVNANNTGLKEASGELIVILQDFILMPEDGIEELVNLYRKNPDALLAPTDRYYKPKNKPDTSSEDWFNGELDVVGDFIWQNPRINNQGLRESQNPYDFEQNYGAIPKKILEDLNGWYEVYDFGLGYDNTDIAYRALKAGYRIIVDETNIAQCIDHWEALKGKDEMGGMDRARRLNDPIFLYMKTMIDEGMIPVRRDEEIENKLDLQYVVPESVTDDEIVEWMRMNAQSIALKWMQEVKI